MTRHVSILTPSFNQCAWLRDNLESVRRQTFPSIEHVVMDGGSTDGSVELLSRWSDRLHWKSEPDRGQSHALNKALAESTGDIIGWLNSDDAYVDRRAVAWAVEAFERNPDVGVVYGHSLLVNATNQVLQLWWAWPAYSCILDVLTPFAQPSAFVRRSLIGDRLVDPSLQYVMDYDLWQRLRTRTAFLRIDRILSIDRHQPQRKVLTSGYPQEVESYRVARDLPVINTPRKLARKTLTMSARAAGMPKLAFLESTLDPAIELKMPAALERLRLQLATARAKMPIA